MNEIGNVVMVKSFSYTLLQLDDFYVLYNFGHELLCECLTSIIEFALFHDGAYLWYKSFLLNPWRLHLLCVVYLGKQSMADLIKAIIILKGLRIRI